jgi:hypothetical protein
MALEYIEVMAALRYAAAIAAPKYSIVNAALNNAAAIPEYVHSEEVALSLLLLRN